MPAQKPSPLVCARGCEDSKGFSSESIFSATRTRVFLLLPGGAGRAPRAGRAQHCPPYAAPGHTPPPHAAAPGPRKQSYVGAGHASPGLLCPQLHHPAPPSPREVLARAGRGVARQEHLGRGSLSSRPRCPVSGLRLQHWNKTQHYITFLFVHLNVYSELHFVRTCPVFLLLLTKVFTDF